MKTFFFFLVFPMFGFAQIVPLPVPQYSKQKMQIADLQFVAGILASNKIHPRLDCEIKFREIRENRKFSTGHKWVEMLEIKFKGGSFHPSEITAYFAVGSPLKKRQTESILAGPVEEIVLESKDPLEHQLILQHDGRGQIVHLEVQTLNFAAPCKQRP